MSFYHLLLPLLLLGKVIFLTYCENLDNALENYRSHLEKVNKMFSMENVGERRSDSSFSRYEGSEKILLHSFSERNLEVITKYDGFGIDRVKSFHVDDLDEERFFSFCETKTKREHSKDDFTGASTSLKYDISIFPNTFNLDLYLPQTTFKSSTNLGSDFKDHDLEEDYLAISFRVATDDIDLIEEILPGSRITTKAVEGKDILYGIVLWREIGESFVEDESKYVEIRMVLTEIAMEDFFAKLDINIDHFPGDEEKVRILEEYNEERRFDYEKRTSVEFNWNYDKGTKGSKKIIPILDHLYGTTSVQLDCTDCYFFFSAGFQFILISHYWAKHCTEVKLGLSGTMHTKIETTLEIKGSYEKDFTLNMINDMLVFTLPVYPPFLVLLFYLSLDARLILEAEAEATIKDSFQSNMKAHAGWYRNGTSVCEAGFEKTFKDSYQFDRPTFEASGKIEVRFEIIPTLTISIDGMIDLDLKPTPYLEYDAHFNTEEGIIQSDGLFFGLDFNSKIGKVTFFWHTLYEGYELPSFSIFRKLVCCEGDSLMFQNDVHPSPKEKNSLWDEKYDNTHDILEQRSKRSFSEAEVPIYEIMIGRSTGYLETSEMFLPDVGMVCFVGDEKGEDIMITVNCVGTCRYQVGYCFDNNECYYHAEIIAVTDTYIEFEENFFNFEGEKPYLCFNKTLQDSEHFSVEMLEIVPLPLYNMSQIHIPERTCKVFQFPNKKYLFPTNSYNHPDLIITFINDISSIFKEGGNISSSPSFLVNVQVLNIDEEDRFLLNCQSNYSLFIPSKNYSEFHIQPFGCPDRKNFYTNIFVRAYSGYNKDTISKIGVQPIVKGGTGDSFERNQLTSHPEIRNTVYPVRRWKYEISPGFSDIFIIFFNVQNLVNQEVEFIFYSQPNGDEYAYLEDSHSDELWFKSFSLDQLDGDGVHEKYFLMDSEGISGIYDDFIIGLRYPTIDAYKDGDDDSSFLVQNCKKLRSGESSAQSIYYEFLGFVYSLGNNGVNELEIIIESSEKRNLSFNVYLSEPVFRHEPMIFHAPGVKMISFSPEDMVNYEKIFIILNDLADTAYDFTITSYIKVDALIEPYPEINSITLPIGTTLYVPYPCNEYESCYYTFEYFSDSDSDVSIYYSFDSKFVNDTVKDENFIGTLSQNNNNNNNGRKRFGIIGKVGSFIGLMNNKDEETEILIKYHEMSSCQIMVSIDPSNPEEAENFNQIRENGMKILLNVSNCGEEHLFSPRILAEVELIEEFINSYFSSDGDVWNSLKTCYFSKLKECTKSCSYLETMDLFTLYGEDLDDPKESHLEIYLPSLDSCGIKNEGNSFEETISMANNFSLVSGDLKFLLSSRDDRSVFVGDDYFKITNIDNNEEEKNGLVEFLTSSIFITIVSSVTFLTCCVMLLCFYLIFTFFFLLFFVACGCSFGTFCCFSCSFLSRILMSSKKEVRETQNNFEFDYLSDSEEKDSDSVYSQLNDQNIKNDW